MPNSSNKAAVGFILITVVLDVLSFGLLIPILPKLIKSFVGGDIADASIFQALFGTVWAAMQFVFSPIMGSLSDRFGRRPVLLISCFGLAADYVLIALAPNLAWLLIGRILSGITAASFSTAGAYIADVTPREKRAAAFGMLGAAFGVGFIIGPAMGGVLGGVDLRLPFWVAAGLTLANALYGYFILPESLPIESRSRFSWMKANPIGSLRFLRSRNQLLGLAGIFFAYQLSHQVLQNTFVLYTDHRFGWKEITVGITLTCVGILNVVVQGALVRRAISRFGERSCLIAGLLCCAVGYFGFGLSNTGNLLWCFLPVFALSGLFGPAIQALLTQQVDVSEQGQLQGVNSSLVGISGMIGPSLFSPLLAVGIRETWAPVGIPFYLAGAIILVACIYGAAVTRSPHTKAGDPINNDRSDSITSSTTASTLNQSENQTKDANASQISSNEIA